MTRTPARPEGVTSAVHDQTSIVLIRLHRVLRDHLTPAVHRDRVPLAVERWVVPGEPVPFTTAVGQEYHPVRPGDAWGRPWGTEWFRVRGTVPAGWAGDDTEVELVVDLGFDPVQAGFQCEGTVYAPDGVVRKAVESHHRTVPVTTTPGTAVELYIEAAANPDVADGWSFRPTPLGDLATAGTAPLYRLGPITLARLDRPVWELVQDVVALDGLVGQLPPDSGRRARIVEALVRALDAVDPDDVSGTAAAGRAELAEVLAQPAHASAHRVFAVGHAHIDSAWLWPARETARKVARTFANVLDLMETHDDLVFAASSAQQYLWLEQTQPELFERLRRRVAEGRFVPVGGMWVESDTNLPGGESLARQLVAGGRYFRERFGVEQPVAWLPDSFGYSAALPQLFRAAGARWFLTQKLSWNETNRFPHHTFLWEGLDGSRVLTHFPPVDSYGAELTAQELARADRQFADKGRSTASLVPFGHGDGGGGPTREMLAAAARTRSLEGSPTVRLAGPAEFFADVEAEYTEPPVWSGELYLEFHRGTYTSQARTKRGNRTSERLLREAELWASAAAVHTGSPYPYEELERCWQAVLLGQFHDILPGTSIAWVHQEAERRHAEVAEVLERLVATSLADLVGTGDVALAANAGPRALDGVPGLSVRPAAETAPGQGVRVEPAPDGDGLVLTTALLRVRVDARGLLPSIIDLRADREVLAPDRPGNLLELFRDVPGQWDAWDIDRSYRNVGTELLEADEVVVAEHTAGQATVRVVRTFGLSRVTQLLTVAAGSPRVEIRTEVDWHERQKLLKWSVPLDVHAERATSEIQFGHVHRPTHVNTSWDAARFETVAQRWVHVGEHGYGVAVANDTVPGHDISRRAREDGGTTTLVRLSLLRAPLYPDPGADQGTHVFTVAVAVGADIEQAVSEGYRLQVPLRAVRGARPVAPLVELADPAIVVEAVKLAEDRSGDVVVRAYEAHGSRARAVLGLGFAAADVVETDLHERPVDPPRALRATAGGWEVELRPFQVVTLRIRR